jgi:very-short-patch-repair endonuclease
MTDGLRKRLSSDPALREQFIANLANVKNRRCSSKAERALCECLKPLGFVRHRVMRTPEGTAFDVDAVSHDGRVGVESDGEWHFRQVHAGHDFEKTRARDASEEIEAVRRGVLLVRLDNQKHGIEEQVRLVLRTIEEWDGESGVVVKHW